MLITGINGMDGIFIWISYWKKVIKFMVWKDIRH